MAATALMAVQPVPDLHSPLTLDDLNKSTITYNGLPRMSSDMNVNQDHVKNLLAIFVKHGLREKIGIHRLHKHDDILEEQVKLETKLETKLGKWTKPVPANSLDLNKIHPIVFKFVFKLVTGELHLRLNPYEFGEGPMPISLCDIDNDYIKEAADYVNKNNLVNVIALELLDSDKDGQLKECTAKVEISKHGTIVLPKSIMNSRKLISTGWPNINRLFNPDGEPDPGTH